MIRPKYPIFCDNISHFTDFSIFLTLSGKIVKMAFSISDQGIAYAGAKRTCGAFSNGAAGLGE
uniref:Uncharacterized protein n=1 Tax=Thermosporothrix sp. COM3 TaxID=2490863 RepID=A0A455SW62_9CHLR|nr:hypothetical protein KTC_65190 [Thermosporothrix sp. COM3]